MHIPPSFQPVLDRLKLFIRSDHRATINKGVNFLRSKKLIWFVPWGVGLLFIILSLITWPAKALCPVAEAVVMRLGATDCQISDMNLSLLGGLEIKRVKLIFPLEGKLSVTTNLPSVHVGLHLFTAAFSWGSIAATLDELAGFGTLDAADDEIDNTTEDDPYAEERPAPHKEVVAETDRISVERLAPLIKCVKSISFNGGVLKLRNYGPWTIGFRNPKVNLNIGWKGEGPTYTGALRSDAILVDELFIGKPRITLKGEWPLCDVTISNGTFYDGMANGKVVLSLEPLAIESGLITAHNSNLAMLYKATHLAGRFTGKGDAKIELDSGGIGLNKLNGSVLVRLEDVSLKDLPVWRRLGIVGMMAGITAMHFPTLKVKGTLKEGKLNNTEITGEGNPVSVTGTGVLRPADGSFRFRFKAVFDPSYQNNVSSLVWNAMIPDEDGKRAVSGVYSGTFTSPRLAVDAAITNRAVNNFFGGKGGGGGGGGGSGKRSGGGGLLD